MLPDGTLELTVGGVFAVMLVNTVLGWWTKLQSQAARRKRRTSPPPPDPMSAQVAELHSILARRDETDTPLLFRLLERQASAMERMAQSAARHGDCLRTQTELLQQIAQNGDSE